MVKRESPPVCRHKHLCADADYRSADSAHHRKHGYIPHVVDRRKEADIKRRDPRKKTRRWVVEVCHSWFNRFRKLLVRYEKPDRSFVEWSQPSRAPLVWAGFRQGVLLSIQQDGK